MPRRADATERGAAAPPVLRAVLLGASNLKMGLPAVVGRLRSAAGGPVEVLAACGHGRSYVGWSRIFFGLRSLPGIAGCGLWQALADLPRAAGIPTVALLMDAGNDLLYGPTTGEIADSVAACLERLAALGAEVVALPLPLVSLEKISGLHYHVARTILFPGRGESWPSLRGRARDLDGRLRGLAAAHGCRLVEPQASWYGLDPIHFRRRRRARAWDEIVAHWRRLPPRPPQPLPRRLRVPLWGSAELRLLGREKRTPQPACRLPDGSTIALF
jgi:hypothetical protein